MTAYYFIATAFHFRYKMHTAFMASVAHPDLVKGFQNTQWSVILTANQTESSQADEALSRLCQTYWYPVYGFIRRRGHDPEPAKDLTQEFFARLIAKRYLDIVDRERGRFRTFLLSCVEHFLSNERRREKALKRGGQYQAVPLADPEAEERYEKELWEELSPDKLLDRSWAIAILEQTFAQLKQEYEETGKGPLFEGLQVFLSGAKDAPCSFSEMGSQLGMSEVAVRQAASRMRGRFGELLRQNVAQTVTNPQDLEAELAHFKSVFSAPARGR